MDDAKNTMDGRLPLSPKNRFLYIGGSLLLILAATLGAQLIRLGNEIFIFRDHTVASVLTSVVYLTLLYVFNLSDTRVRMSWFETAFRTLVMSGIGMIIIAFFFYALPQWSFGRGLLFLQGLLAWLFLFIWRIYFINRFSRAQGGRPLIVIGAGAKAAELSRILAFSGSPYTVRGYLSNGESRPLVEEGAILGSARDLDAAARATGVRTFVLALDGEIGEDLLRAFLSAKMRGFQISDQRVLMEELGGRVPLESLEAGWFINQGPSALLEAQLSSRIKRLMDITVSLLLLPLALPVLVLSSLLILLTSGWPVLIRQQRVGRFGRVFRIWKLRTMKRNMENGDVAWASPNDPRITRVGRVIRRFRIDELPQLVNVLRGEMSLVGPRPEQFELARKLEAEIKFYGLRHLIKPGITGWAQIIAPYGGSLEETLTKLEYDYYYLKNMSFLFDVKIMLRTVGVMIFGDGAR